MADGAKIARETARYANASKVPLDELSTKLISKDDFLLEISSNTNSKIEEVVRYCFEWRNFINELNAILKPSYDDDTQSRQCLKAVLDRKNEHLVMNSWDGDGESEFLFIEELFNIKYFGKWDSEIRDWFFEKFKFIRDVLFPLFFAFQKPFDDETNQYYDLGFDNYLKSLRLEEDPVKVQKLVAKHRDESIVGSVKHVLKSDYRLFAGRKRESIYYIQVLYRNMIEYPSIFRTYENYHTDYAANGLGVVAFLETPFINEEDFEQNLNNHSGLMADQKNESNLIGRSIDNPSDLANEIYGNYLQVKEELLFNRQLKQLKVFISYSREDNKEMRIAKDVIYKVQSDLDTKEGLTLDIWNDEGLLAGENFIPKILEQLASTDVAIILVSNSFLNSKFIEKIEFKELVARKERGDCRIIPILVSKTDKDINTVLGSIEVIPSSTKKKEFTSVKDWNKKKEKKDVWEVIEKALYKSILAYSKT